MMGQAYQKLSDALSCAEFQELFQNCTGHSLRVARYFELMLQLYETQSEKRESTSQRYILSEAARFHDIGKIFLPPELIYKREEWTPDEREKGKLHTVLGGEYLTKMLKRQPFDSFILKPAIEFAIFHHERWDGTGYPNKLADTDIPLNVRLLSICDVYEALTSRRCYKAAYSHGQSLEILESESEKAFDPELIKLFLKHESKFKELKLHLFA